MDVDVLVVEAAKELVKALAGGAVEMVKKVPDLWRRSGERKRESMAGEVDRSVAQLREAGKDLPVVHARQEGVWEGRLRDLVVEDPDAVVALQALLDQLRATPATTPTVQMNVTASGQGSTAQGAVNGNVITYTGGVPASPPATTGAEGRSEAR